MNNMVEEFKNVFRKPDNALAQLILINVVVFVLLGLLKLILRWTGLDALYMAISNQFALPSVFNSFIYRPWTLITYAFNHAGIFHIFFNMLVMYWFGKLLMEYLGSRKLTAIYVLGALAGGITFLLIFNLVPYYIDRSGASMVGASGAVFAIVVAAATLMPDHKFHLIFLGPVSIKYIAIFVILTSFLRLDGSNAGGEMAHLGGALMGFLYISQLRKGRDLGKPVSAVTDFFRNLFKKRSKIKVSYSARETSYRTTGRTTSRSAAQKNWSRTEQQEIDDILDKISEKGYESLTKEEKQKLFNASKK